MSYSLRDAAFALDAAIQGPWSLRRSLSTAVFPPLTGAAVSLRDLTSRYSAPGRALRSLANGTANVWAHMSRTTIISEISDRLRDPMIINQSSTGLCGAIAIVTTLVRRDPVRYIHAANELLETGKFTCPTGRVIEADCELRDEPVIVNGIGQVDWLLAATMRDDANIWIDVDDDANGLESMTFWGDQYGWIRDVLALPSGGWETCFVEGETDCMKKAEEAVKAGGVAYFLVDANLIKDGGSDTEEDMHWQSARHVARSARSAFSTAKHSMDDDFPPDHWVEYLGGLNLGSDTSDSDRVAIRLWSWGSEYLVTGTVDAFTEYLYAVCTGYA